MVKALRDPALFRLWIGQAFSSIGDEIYRVGLVWFAVGLLGSDTGYLVASQTAALMVMSFVGGRWGDRRPPLQTMMTVDLLRAFLVLIPVAISFYRVLPLGVLWTTALLLSGLSAFFDPAIQATIPLLAKDRALRQSTNGLMGTTIRMARMIGPAVVGVLSALVPMIHFFTIDAVTFLISATCVGSLRRYVPQDMMSAKPSASFSEAISAGFKKIRHSKGMPLIFAGKFLTTGTWNLALMIGFPLLVHDLTGGNAKSFGFVMASYGVGNFLGALIFGNRPRRKLTVLLFGGYVLLGIGFVCMGLAGSLTWLIAAAAVTGFTGPLNDLAFLDLMQEKFDVADLTKVFRLRIAVESAGTLFFTLISPWMIARGSVRTVIIICGVVWIVTGLFSFWRSRHSVELQHASEAIFR
jgi:MFS family permease